MSFATVYGELTLTIPKLPVTLAKIYVNRARRDIYESRPWSFLRAFGYLQIPDAVGLGTFTVTQNSITATANATATTALTGLSFPLITDRQIRFAGGPIYNIRGFSGSTITLDRPYGEGSTVGIGYQVYKCYYGPPLRTTSIAVDASNNPLITEGTPETDFFRYYSVLDPIQPQVLDTSKDRRWLDMRDPQRTSIGPPAIRLCAFTGETADQAGLPLYEMHPHPTSNRMLLCTYRKGGTTDFTADTDTLPAVIPENCLVSRALWYGYKWAMTNQGRYVELRQAAAIWPTLRKDALAEYNDQLNRARLKDDDIMKSRVVSSEVQWPTWMQSFLNQMNYQGGMTTPPL